MRIKKRRENDRREGRTHQFEERKFQRPVGELIERNWSAGEGFNESGGGGPGMMGKPGVQRAAGQHAYA